VGSVRSLRRREVTTIFDSCLTTPCTGAAAAMRPWLLVRRLGGPVMSSVRHLRSKETWLMVSAGEPIALALHAPAAPAGGSDSRFRTRRLA
jgi:hypothetical protein